MKDAIESMSNRYILLYVLVLLLVVFSISIVVSADRHIARIANQACQQFGYPGGVYDRGSEHLFCFDVEFAVPQENSAGN